MWRLLSSLWKRPPAGPPAPAPTPEPAPEPFPVVERPLEGYRQLGLLDSCLGGDAFRALDPAGNEVILTMLHRNSVPPQSDPAALVAPYHSLANRFLLRIVACHLEADRVTLVWESAGESLHDWHKRCHRDGAPGIPAAPLLSSLGEVAVAIDYLHSRGLFCRSLRPRSVLLREGHVRLWDYVTVELQSQVPVRLPPQCLAPEEVQHRGVTAASDQHRLAVLYQQMRTGQVPYGGENLFELLQQITRGNADLSPLPEGERPVVGRALNPDPARRFRNCVEFVDALKAAVAPDCLRALPGRSRADPAWLAWNDGTVGKLAAAIDDANDLARLPLLADALEDAGCSDAKLLGHLRGPGPHVRGCRALGLLLRKE